MGISVVTTDSAVVNLRKRMPFHFGNVVVEEGAHLLLHVTAEIDGETATGLSQAGLEPSWFLKNPNLSMDAGIESLLSVFEAAWTSAREVEAETPFAFWEALYARQREWAAGTDHLPLFWNYGVSLVEQAIIDAFCRAKDTTFATAVREGLLGINLGQIYDELDGERPEVLLPDDPLRETALRHTVGLTDPLVNDDLEPDKQLHDNLPQTLAEYIEKDGVSRFKVKLSSDADRDIERLQRIFEIVTDRLNEFAFTLDANEGYASAAAFREAWKTIQADAPEGILDRLLYIEQPLARDASFTDATQEVFSNWDGPPIIIDESDDRPDSLQTALGCGYAGTSHKNCKGVFDGIVNRCLIEYYHRNSDDEYVISGEDLTTLGPVELPQDLAVMATIGANHVERNGHHYYRGLSMFSEDVQNEVLDAHGDLYRRHDAEFATLDVRDGRIRLGSVVDAPFGRALDLDFKDPAFTPSGEWDVKSIYR